MNPHFFYPLFIALLFAAGSCNQKKDNSATQTQTEEQTPAQPPKRQSPPLPYIYPVGQATGSVATGIFTYPEPPFAITDLEAQVDYVTEHFWDSFKFNDTLSIYQPEIRSEVFMAYIALLHYADKEVAGKSIEKTLSNAEAEKTGAVYAFFVDGFKTYLHDPNSIIRNDEFYIPVLQHIIASERTDYADRERAKFNLETAMKNRVGEKASDFTYTLSSEKTGALYDIEAKYTLIYFYNPDCHTCAETMEQLKISPFITQKIKNGELNILAFYPDEDLEIWKKHLSDVPKEWINGYDGDHIVRAQNLYDLKAIPTLYLLDSNKRVLLKDAASVQVVDQYFQVNR